MYDNLFNNNNNSVANYTERSTPFIGEVSANFSDRGVSRSQCSSSPTAVISWFLDRIRWRQVLLVFYQFRKFDFLNFVMD
jgi:hypothetical protein